MPTPIIADAKIESAESAPVDYSTFVFDDLGSERVTRILHISDLHFGAHSAEPPKSLEHLIASLPKPDEEKLDVVVCTGDLVDNPLGANSEEAYLSAARAAKRWLVETLCRTLMIDPKTRLVIVPGNHDYRLTGLLRAKPGFKSAWNVGCDAVSRAIPWLSLPKTAATELPFKRLFKSEFGNYMRPIFLPGLKLCVINIDSNGCAGDLDLASGEITPEELDAAKAKLKAFSRSAAEKANRAFTSAFKIAAIHHHPMPLPASEVRPNMDADPYMILKNSGTFLKEMIRQDIDIVLHGHKHEYGYSAAAFETGSGLSNQVHILAAGSGAKNDTGKYSYNVISLSHDGVIKCRRMISISQQDTMQPYVEQLLQLGNQQDVRKSRFYRLARQYPVKAICDEHFYFHNIDTRGGSRITSEYKWLRPFSGAFGSLPQKFSDACTLLEEPTCDLLKGNQKTIVPKLESMEGAASGEVTFTPEVTPGQSLFFQLRWQSTSGFAFTRELARRKYNRDYEEHGILSRQKISERLVLSVRFPDQAPTGFPPQGLRVEVEDENGKPNDEETAYACERLCAYRRDQTVRLHVDYPLPGHLYALRWDLPRLADLVPGHLVNEGDALETALTAAGAAAELEPVLRSIRSALPIYFGKSSKLFEKDEIGLIAFDRSIQELRYVAGLEPHSSDIYTELKPRIGSGVEGLPFSSALSVFLSNQSHAWSSLHPAGSWNARNVFACGVPLFYPKEFSHRVVCVLRIASPLNTSPLLKLADATDEKERLDFLTYFTDIVHNKITNALA